MIINRQNIWKIIWVVGVYATLVLILYLVVIYKVKWEDLDLNKYLYFYECSNELCTSESAVDKYYSSIKCDDNICPYITEKKDNYVILKKDDTSYVYDYQNGKIINNTYTNYQFTNNDYLIATNKENQEGIIDYQGKIIFDFKYKEIVSYNYDYITYKENKKIGITDIDNYIDIKPTYDNVCLIDENKYAYLDNDGYYIAKYGNDVPISNTIYDYIYSANKVIFTIADNKIDILDNNLRSKLLMKISTYYGYKTEKERKTLNLHTKDNIIYFKVYLGNDEYKQYIYDTITQKLYD